MLHQLQMSRSQDSTPSQAGVLIVDPQEITQIGLRVLFGSRPWVSRCFATHDAAVAEGITRRHRPQLALVSMELGEISGLRVCSALRFAVPGMKILLMSSSGSVDARHAARFGADAVVPRSVPAAFLVNAGQALLQGRKPGRLIDNEATQGRRLSPRESEVLEKLSEGLSNPEIARTLHLSQNTVKQHTSALYRKLGVKNRAQAASVARAHGLVA